MTDTTLAQRLRDDIKAHEVTGNGNMRRVETMREAVDRIEADASTIASLRDTIKALTAERDYAISEMKEARAYRNIETGHAESAEADRDHLSAELAKAEDILRSMEPHVREIRNAVRINDEWGRVVQGQTLAATALAEILDAFLASKEAPQPEAKEARDGR